MKISMAESNKVGRDKMYDGQMCRGDRQWYSYPKGTERQNGEYFGWESGVLVEHYRKLGTPKTKKRSDTEFEKGIDAWARANVEASKREDCSPKKSQKEFTRDQVRKRVALLKYRKAAEADEIVNAFLKHEGEGTITMIAVL